MWEGREDLCINTRERDCEEARFSDNICVIIFVIYTFEIREKTGNKNRLYSKFVKHDLGMQVPHSNIKPFDETRPCTST